MNPATKLRRSDLTAAPWRLAFSGQRPRGPLDRLRLWLLGILYRGVPAEPGRAPDQLPTPIRKGAR